MLLVSHHYSPLKKNFKAFSFLVVFSLEKDSEVKLLTSIFQRSKPQSNEIAILQNSQTFLSAFIFFKLQTII